MKFSLIIPSYDNKVALERTLAALFSYKDQPDEVIVVDDGSRESLVDLAEYFPIRYFQLYENFGAGYARNFGANKAVGDVLVFIDSDVVPQSNYLRIIRDEIETGFDGVGGRYCLPAELKTSLNAIIHYQEELYWDALGDRAEVAILYGGLCAFKKSAWLSKDRTFREVQAFKHKASGEDCFVCLEISQNHKLIYRRDLIGQHYSDLEKRLFLRSANQAESRSRNIFLNGRKTLRDSVAQQFKVGVFLAGYSGFFLSVFFSFPFELISLGLFYNGYYRFFKKFKLQSYPQIIRFIFIQQSAWVFGVIRWISKIASDKIYSFLSWTTTSLTYLLRNSPNKLFFFVTNRCNSDCSWCLDKTRGGKNQPARKSAELSIEEIHQITLNYPKSIPSLTITGGEPFLRLDVDQIVTHFYRNNTTRFVTIVTNGSFPDQIKEQIERILIQCPFLKLNVQLTVSDLPEQHDEIRKLKNSSLLIEQSTSKLHHLKKIFSTLMFTIATQIEDTKIERLPLIIDHVYKNLNPDEHFLALIRDVPNLISRKNASLEKIVEFSEQLAIKYKKRLNLFQSFYNRTVLSSIEEINKIRENRSPYRPCKAGKKFLTLYENGNLLACENRQDLIAANLRDQSYRLDKKEVSDGLERIHRLQLKEKCHCDWGCAVTDNLMGEPRFFAKNFGLALMDYVKQSF